MTASVDKQLPRLSIVTVCYNAASLLENTILSVMSQTVVPYEYILVDGGSTDNSLAKIRKFVSLADSFGIKYRWVSEKDQGIADAFNKGIQMATGDYVGLINAGDGYVLDAIEIMQKAMQSSSDVYCGRLFLTDEKGNYLRERKSRPWLLWNGMYVLHPTTFVKRSIYDTHHFDTDLMIAMDYDLILSLWKEKKSFQVIKKPISYMQTGGVSFDVKAMRREELLVMRRYLNRFELICARTKILFDTLVFHHILKRF